MKNLMTEAQVENINTKELVIEYLKENNQEIKQLEKDCGIHSNVLFRLLNQNIQLDIESAFKIVNFINNFSEELVKKHSKEFRINTPVAIEVAKPMKTKHENRHRNLTCPNKDYHMKVPYKYLKASRPFCPCCGSPMLLKEEVKMLKDGLSIDLITEKTDINAILKNK